MGTLAAGVIGHCLPRSTVVLAVVVGLALLFNAGTSHAQNARCMQGIEKADLKWLVAAKQALSKCKIALLKDKAASDSGQDPVGQGADPDCGKAVGVCEKILAKLFGKADAKFLAAWGELFAKGTCTPADLVASGHLTSPAQAPGAATQDWVSHWLKWAKWKLAIKEILFEYADFFNDIQREKRECHIDCPAGTTGTPAVEGGPYPNFCLLNLNCEEHECELSAASNTTTSLGGGALTVTRFLVGSTVFEVCKVKDPFNFDPGFYYIISEPARTIGPVDLSIFGTVCIDVVKSEGWCNCTGAPVAIPDSMNFCQDHIATSGAVTCPGTATGPNTVEGPCFCTDPNGVKATQCGPGVSFCPAGQFCGSTVSGGECHPGTTNSAVFVNSTGVALNGACINLNTISFTRLPAGGNCGNGKPASFGPDCTPCTADDTIPPAAPASIRFTTGAASAQVLDAVLAEGTCSNPLDSNTRCIEKANCGANPNDTCVGAIINPNDSLPGLTGVRIDPNTPGCPDLEAGNLSGLSFVGAFPALDSSGGLGGLGDVISTFTLTCQ